MGLRYRTIRAAASALAVAAAVGAGGMTGMGSALAADPAMAALGGRLVDGVGSPLGGIELTIVEELPPDGGIAAFPVTTTQDGSFEANLYAWGTAAAPAVVTISSNPDQELELIGESCTETWGVTMSDRREYALADAAPEPLTLTATTTLLAEACATTGTPGGSPATGGPGAGSGDGGSGGDSGANGGAERTPPPTDLALAAGRPGPDRLGAALTLGFLAGVAMTGMFLLPRGGSRGWPGSGRSRRSR